MKPHIRNGLLLIWQIIFKCRHDSQELIEQSNDRILFKLKTCSSNEIKRWVLSFGNNAEVVKPNWLKKEIKEELKQALENY
ncbi:MAG: helix-turn-helix transcriptional regulator [bacterium]